MSLLRTLMCKSTATVRATPRAMLAASSNMKTATMRGCSLLGAPLRGSALAVPSSPALVRMLATAARSSGGAPPPAVKKAPAAPTLADTKADLASLASTELKNVEPPAADHPYSAYIKEHGLDVNWDFKNDVIVIKKAKNGYDVRVVFNTTGHMDEDPENPEDEENKDDEDQEGQDDERPQQYQLLIHVSKAGKTPMRVHGLVGKDGKLYFEGFTIGNDDYAEIKEVAEELNVPYRVEYNDMSTELQDKLADFMDHLRIDDEFAQFVPAAISEQMRAAMHRNLSQLVAFAKDS